MSVDLVRSFGWVTVDSVGEVRGPERIYSDALPPTLLEEAFAQLVQKGTPRVWITVRPSVGDVNVAIKELSTRCFTLLSSHRLDSSGELLQCTLIQCGQEDANAASGWEEFCNEIEPLVPADCLPSLDALWKKQRKGPTAFTARMYEGVMPDVEVVHQAFAATLFRQRCSLSLPQPTWASRSGDDE